MDAVYILGHGSLVENEELRFSVRSLEKHMLDLGNIFIVGAKPNFLPGAIHIAEEDAYKEPWKNAYLKTKRACDLPELTEEFLLMNDDFFLNAPFLGAEFPFYCARHGDAGPSGRINFGLHCPMVINKDWYSKLPLTFDMKGSYSPRSFYANFIRAPGKTTDDCIVRTGKGLKSFADQIRKQDFFSISDVDMLDPDFRSWLEALYPSPSRFE